MAGHARAALVEVELVDGESLPAGDGAIETLLSGLAAKGCSLAKLQHGDLVYCSDGFRGREVYAVDKSDTGIGPQLVNLMEISDCEYGHVPVKITQHLGDPCEFYGHALDSDNGPLTCMDYVDKETGRVKTTGGCAGD